MRRLLAVILTLWPTVAVAQTLSGDRLRLAAPCTMTATAGSPGQWNISDCPILATAASNITLRPAGDVVLDPQGADVLPGTGYTVNLGALTKKYLTLHAAELWVETLVAQNTIATIGGRVLVAPTNILSADLAAAATTITVKYNNFQNGDRVYMEANGQLEWMAVTSSAGGIAGAYTYSVTRDLDSSGANNWTAGDAVLNTGTTGKGFIDLYSLSGVLSGAGPTIVGNVRTGTAFNAVAPRWAVGNLNGLFNYGVDTYGAAFGDASATNVTVDATNGFRIRNGTTVKLAADTAGNLSLTGDLSIGTSGVFRSNATGFTTGTGWWMDYNGGTPRFRIGNPAGNRLTWDGTTLAVYGDGQGVTNIDGGNITTNTINVGSLNATGFGGNLVRNGRFEGSNSAAGTSGWYLEESTGGSSFTWFDKGGAGPDGPGYLDYDPGSGFVGCVAYRATPVLAGQKYRVHAQMLSYGGSSTVAWSVLMFESTSTSAGVRNIVLSGASAPDVNRTSFTALASGAAGTGSWQDVEYTYTVPAGVYWASLGVCNVSGPPSSSTYRPLLADGIEFQEQIGAGHIKASSITAAQIAANTITASQIAAGTITATQIASGTITASNIATGTITANEIAAGTITGAKIAAGTITASNLSVSSLSAIVANLGTVTSGEIYIGGNFVVNSSGLLTAISAVFNGGVAIHATIPQMITIDGPITLSFGGGGGNRNVCVDNGGFIYYSGGGC